MNLCIPGFIQLSANAHSVTCYKLRKITSAITPSDLGDLNELLTQTALIGLRELYGVARDIVVVAVWNEYVAMR